MPLINLRVDDATKQLWVEAASGELLTLSEWIRKACDARLGLADRYVDIAYQPTLEEVPAAAEEVAAGEPASREAPTVPPEEPSRDPHPPVDAQPSAPAATQPEREFQPDFKAAKPVKKKRW